MASVGSIGTQWFGTRSGFVFNYHVTTIHPSTGETSSYGNSTTGHNTSTTAGGAAATGDELGSGSLSALRLFMQDDNGEIFETCIPYAPYFLVAPAEGCEREVELGLAGAFGPLLLSLTRVEKEDLGMLNHLSGKRRTFLKCTFANTNDLTAVRGKLLTAVQRNQSGTNQAVDRDGTAHLDFELRTMDELFAGPDAMTLLGGAGDEVFAAVGDQRPCQNSQSREGSMEGPENAAAQHVALNNSKGNNNNNDKFAWMRRITDLREHDVKYFVRVAIDLNVFVGCWYDVTHIAGATPTSTTGAAIFDPPEATIGLPRPPGSNLEFDPPAVTVGNVRFQLNTAKVPISPKACAFDIETTKAPLKFPQVEKDEIYMLSYMFGDGTAGGRGGLIVSRSIVGQDIAPFDYTPKPEYSGDFAEVFNEENEAALLSRFFIEMKKHRPLVYVTYNGDYFDWPFIAARASHHGMDMKQELGFAMNREGATLHYALPHLDCFYWVKRDSYLPQGSHGLKAVTRAKLGYEPIEIDPEDMLPLAQTQPLRMASYSVSDAVATYYLYLKYVHPFIYSLCTIIPMAPDDVLRKGSGTLCESLLMVQAYKKNVVYPNKQVQVREKFYNGHLLDSETYIGGRVEALESGVFRSDIPLSFNCNPAALEGLQEQLDAQLKFAIEVENGVKLSDVKNYDEVRSQIYQQLQSLKERPKRDETPMIYHLDVGAMYPNIILTNRLQPPSMVTSEMCAACCYNSPDNALKCKRTMQWKWKGEVFTASKHEYHRVKAQLESESFSVGAQEKADAGAVVKKTYGNKRGNVLEGTAFEKKESNFHGGSGHGKFTANTRYRRGVQEEQQRREAVLAALGKDGDDSGSEKDSDSEDEDGNRKFNKLKENTQFSLLKKRLGEYSRKAYRKAHETVEILQEHVVCQREDSFYVDTVRLFRDRRYHYKAELKRWKGELDKALKANDGGAIKVAKSRTVQMESLQLAHKCILNSFYGYVMRKGSRWYSMEMAGVVTYLGASLIMIARALVQQLGVTLELDTDGIWCCLPSSFPENYTFETTNPKKSKVTISYPCVMLNKDVQDKNTNHQYQDIVKAGDYKMHSECSIYFEVDGPYKAMILPASREEGKSIKKRYAVFDHKHKLTELKGFELKRRGELNLIKEFQSQVFQKFLHGTTLREAYAAAAEVANEALDLLHSHGEGYDDDEVLAKLSESSNMSRRLSEYPASQKSLALTTARRIGEFLGPGMVKDKGLACHFCISRYPHGKPVTERAIPLNIFKAEPGIRVTFLRKWTGEESLGLQSGIKDILDWEYYIGRFNGCVQKIITIPAALQFVANPVPRVEHPDWLGRVIKSRVTNLTHRQLTLEGMFETSRKKLEEQKKVRDIEDLIPSGLQKNSTKATAIGIAAQLLQASARHQHKTQNSQAMVGRGEGSSGNDLPLTLATVSEIDVIANTESRRQYDDHEDISDAESDDSVVLLQQQAEAARIAEAVTAAKARERSFMKEYFSAPKNLPSKQAKKKSVETKATLSIEDDDDEPVEDEEPTEDASTRQHDAFPKPLDGTFFKNPIFNTWLNKQKEKWRSQAHTRRELLKGANTSSRLGTVSTSPSKSGNLKTAAAQSVLSQLDTRMMALGTTWHILEVRPCPQCPSTFLEHSSTPALNSSSALVTVFALLHGRSIHTFQVLVERPIVVDVNIHDESLQLVDVSLGNLSLPQVATSTLTLPDTILRELPIEELRKLDTVARRHSVPKPIGGAALTVTTKKKIPALQAAKLPVAPGKTPFLASGNAKKIGETPLLQNRTVLPRRKLPMALYEVDVSKHLDGGDSFVRTLQWQKPEVLNLYEAEVSAVDRAIVRFGCVCSVTSGTFRSRIFDITSEQTAVSALLDQRHPQHRTIKQQFCDVFLSSELETHGAAGYLAHPSGGGGQHHQGDINTISSSAFVFFAHSSGPDAGGTASSAARALIACIFGDGSNGIVVTVLPASAQRPNLRMREFSAEAFASLQQQQEGTTKQLAPVPEKFEVLYANDVKSAMTIINDRLLEKGVPTDRQGSSSLLHLILLEANESLPVLSDSLGLTAINVLPVMRISGAAEDARLFHTHALTWTRELSRRMLQRYFAAPMWYYDRLSLCRLSGIPLANLRSDGHLAAWDALFTRAMKQYGHLRWTPKDVPRTGTELQPVTPKANAGGYLTWCVELSLTQLDVVAVLFSQSITENDDARASAALGLDGGVSSYFGLLRGIVSEVYATAVRGSSPKSSVQQQQVSLAAATLLTHFPRWLRCTNAACYEPLLVSYIDGLATRALTALIGRITKLGGRIVCADTQSVVVATNKNTLVGAIQFTEYLTTALSDSPMLRHLAPIPVRFWTTLLIHDTDQFIGLGVAAAAAMEHVTQGKQRYANLKDQETCDPDAVLEKSEPVQLAQGEKAPVPDTISNVEELIELEVPHLLEVHHCIPVENSSSSEETSMNVHQRLLQRLSNFLASSELCKQQARRAVLKDPSVTLATKYTRYLQTLAGGLAKLVSEMIQPLAIEDVQEILQDPTFFRGSDAASTVPTHALYGSTAVDSAAVSVAVQYIKLLCGVLQLVPGASSAVRSCQNNCLRMCRMSQFSPELNQKRNLANVFPSSSPVATLLQNPTVVSTRCPFCNATTQLDTSLPAGAVPSTATAPAQPPHWICGQCQLPFVPHTVEGNLVRKVHELTSAVIADDAKCAKCFQVASTSMRKLCELCGGDLHMWLPSTRKALEQMADAASKQCFEDLATVVRSALATIA